jgi:hypothetical protein
MGRNIGMKYERLTKKTNNGYGISGELVKQKQPAVDIAIDSFDIVINRLAELEDKIENGTLIETEYSIYQEVYFIDYVDENYYSVGAIKGKPTVRKAFIHSVEQVMKGQILYLIQPYDLPQEVIDNEVEHTETWEWFHYSKKNLFLTKAEAEQKLKELQNG